MLRPHAASVLLNLFASDPKALSRVSPSESRTGNHKRLSASPVLLADQIQQLNTAQEGSGSVAPQSGSAARRQVDPAGLFPTLHIACGQLHIPHRHEPF
jgi:hypothetical protein